MTTLSNHKQGLDAEELSSDYLKQDGYTILSRRFKTKHGEIDIIAQHSDIIAFIEVKRRKSEVHDDPITSTQKNRIANAALQYISEHPEISNMDLRFDCILVDTNNNITHIKDAWRLES